MRDVHVFNRLNQSWVKLDLNNTVVYTTDKTQAHVFSFRDLVSAVNGGIEAIYSNVRDFNAVPVGSNMEPYYCLAIRTYIREQLQREAGDFS